MKLAYKLFSIRNNQLESYNRSSSDLHGLGLSYCKGEVTKPKIEGSKLFVLDCSYEYLTKFFGPVGTPARQWVGPSTEFQIWLVECDDFVEPKRSTISNWLITGANFPKNNADLYSELVLEFDLYDSTKLCNWVRPIGQIL